MNRLERSVRSAMLPLLVVVAALELGCGASGGAQDAGVDVNSPGDPAGQVLGADGSGRAVTLAPDDVLTLRLPAQASTGATWIVAEVHPAVLALAAREQVTAKVIGGEDTEVLRFTGVGAGTTSLRLEYRQPWEPATAATRAVTYTVTVAGRYAGTWVPRQIRPAARLSAAAVTAPGLPSAYKLCDASGGCTPVRSQRECGSCWAFATAGVFENVLALTNHASYDLSEQYLVSCNPWGYSCRGGNVAFDLYIATTPPGDGTAGAVYESSFPYENANGTCAAPYPHHEKAANWSRVNPYATPSVPEMKQAMLDHGPLWVGVCADNAFGTYPGGLFHGTGCTNYNHAVVLTGWDDNGGDGYWILRNSWGTNWGEQGYMRIAYGANMVGVEAAYVDYPGYVPPTEAAVPSGTIRAVTPGGKCLDVTGVSTADGAPLQIWSCNAGGAQPFHLEARGGGAYRMVNTNSGKCVDVSAAGTADGTAIQLWTCNGTAAQDFRAVDVGGAVNLVNTNSGKCVDVRSNGTADGTPVQLWSCNGTGAQRWTLRDFGAANLALGMPSAASSVEAGSSLTADLAFDGDLATRWSSAFADPQWIDVDLGSVQTIRHVRLSWEAAYASQYEILVSTDGATWTTAYKTTSGPGGVEDVYFPPVDARYVAMYGEARATPYGYSLFEMGVSAY